MMSTDTAPRIYVACLAAYNAGRLHGRWIDAAQDADAIHAEVHAMLAASPVPGAEECAIHDYEGFAGIRIGEYDSIETVAKLAALLDEHGAAIAAFYDNQPGYWDDNLDDIEPAFQDAYCGEWESERAYAEDYAESTGALQEDARWPYDHIDWDDATEDLMQDYWSTSAPDGGVFIFHAH